MSTKFVLAGEARLQREVRKSRFLAQAHPVEDADAALAFVSRVSERDATHNCWAYRVGALYRFTDDGEPGGTAGKPILQAIDAQNIDRAIVVVTRWFGGIKLGAGGLARAYGGSAAECLRVAAKRPLIALAIVRARCDFAAAAALHGWLHDHAAVKRNERFLEEGVELELELPEAEVPALVDRVRDLTRGRGQVEAQ
ncbi:MAG TPA: YigZ family protein [Rhodanobacteraceae bacterium]|jgi:uncharacterized YigZ family protein|nr:YigZ family protein [Rhodanobacteraceae bacterium]